MKNLKNLGQALSKAEQQTINGGKLTPLPEEWIWCYDLVYGEHRDYPIAYQANGNCDTVVP